MNGRPLWLAALGLLCLSACDKPESSAQPAEKQKVEDVKTISAATGRFSLYVLVNTLIPPDNHDFVSSRRCSFTLNQAK